jgi:DNA repair exonuclease SbcCD nuclease subunit
MRFLIFSDPHCHAFRPESELLPSGLNSRLQDSLNVLEQIYVLCRKHEVDCVLCGGDLFHARAVISVSTFNLVYEAIAKIKTVVNDFILVVGNHDQANKIGTVHATQTFQAIVTVVDTPAWVSVDPDVNIFCVPFSENREDIVNAIAEGVQEAPQGTKILLGHFGVSGAEPGSNFVLTSSDIPTLPELQYNKFTQVFLGHYHKPQELLSNVRYIGATQDRKSVV